MNTLPSSAVSPRSVATRRLFSAMAALPALAILTPVAQGADFYWDSNGGTSGTGGTGNWTTANSSIPWRDGSAAGTLGAWTDGNNAVFGGTAGSVTLTSGVTIATPKINVTASNYSLSGGTVAFGGTPGSPGIIDVNSATGFTFASNATGSLKMMSTGGPTTLATATAMLINGGTNLTSFELALANDNNHIILNHASALGTASSTVKLTKGVVNLGNNASPNNDVPISYNAWATDLAGGSIRARFNASTWNGATSLSADSLLMTRGSGTVSLIFSSTGTINLNANTLNINSASASQGVDLQGIVSGTGNISLVNTARGGADNGQGITKLSAANTFSGTATTTQNLGTLALNHVNALQNATLDTSLSGTQAVTFVVAGTNTYNIGALTGADPLAIGGNTISVGNKAADTTFAADIGGTSGNLTKVGSNKLTLTASTSYTGATSITGGTLALSGSGAVNSSSGITINGSGAKLLQTGSTAISPTVTLTQGTLTGSATVNTVNVGAGTGGIISNNDGVAGAALSIGNLTFTGAANIDLFSNSTTAGLNVTTLTNNSASNAVTITANNTGGWSNGSTYNLIGYTTLDGTGGNNFAHAVNNLSARQNATWGDNGSAITLAIAGDNPRWMGDTDGKWNLTTANNWKLVTGGNYTNFLATDDVLFDDNATGTTTIDIDVTNVAPNTTIFNNSSKGYSLTGAFGISSGSLTKNGTGSLTISTNNTYTGPTTLNAGTVTLSGSGRIGSASALTLGGAALDLGGTSQTTGAVSITSPAASGDTLSNGSITGTSYSASNASGNAIISANLLVNGAIGFDKSGAGTVTLSGANNYTGTTAINGGSVVLSGSGTLGNGAGLALGGGAVDLGSLSAAVGAVSITAPAASGDTISNGSLTGTSYAAANTSGNAIISGNLLANGAAGFTMSGVGGTVTLSGANTYTGATAVSAGTMKAGSATAFQNTNALSLSGTSTFDLGGFSGSFTNLTSAATNTITTTGAGSGTDVLTISALGSDAGASALFTDNGVRKLQLELTSGGSGSWQATSNINNTYSGGLILNGSMRANVLAGPTIGTPGAITSGQFGTGSITVNGNSQIWFAGSNRTLVNDIVVNGNASAGNGSRAGTFRIGTNSTALTGLVVSGSVTANSVDAWFGSDSTADGTALLLSGKLTGNSGFRFFQSANAFAWTTTLNNGTGSPNDYSGATTINSAQTTLALGAANQIPNGVGKGNVVLTSGFLDLAGFDETINGLSGAGTVNNVLTGTANTLTLGDGDATAQIFSGAIQNTFGTLSLTKIGSGTQILSGTNTYSGATLISAGTLQIGNGGATGVLSASSTITNNGTLAFNRTGTVTQGTDFAAGITGSGALTTSGSGTVILSGTNSYAGNTTISNGELRLASATAINGTSGITVNSGRLSLDGGIIVGSGKSVTVNGTGGNFFGALQGNSGDNIWEGDVVVGATGGTRIGVNAGSLKIAGAISGSTAINGVTLRPNNGTTLEISGANTYLGNTTIVSGTGEVKLSGGADRLPTGTKLIFGGSGISGILNLNGQNQEVAGLSVSSGTANEIKSATAATLTVNTAASSPSTYAGIITGATSLTKTGADSLTLSGINTYTGLTTVSSGTLEIAGTGSINNTSGISVNGGLFKNNSSVAVSPGLLNFTSGTIGGTNLSGVSISVGTNQVLSPGNSPGTMTAGATTFGQGGTFVWEINNATPGGEGTKWDLLMPESLTIAAGAGGFTVSLVSLVDPTNVAGSAAAFDPDVSQNFLFVDSPSTISSFSTTAFAVATPAFSNSFTGSWTIKRGDHASIGGSDTDLYVSYSAVPEPSAYATFVGLSAVGLALCRRRQRKEPCTA